MIRKYHNHTLQIDRRHREEEPQNNNSRMTSPWKTIHTIPMFKLNDEFVEK